MNGQGALLAALTGAGVEPLALRVSDGEGRWTVTLAHVVTPTKGNRKAERNTQATCSCGFMIPHVSLNSWSSGASLSNVHQHIRNHVLAETPVKYQVEEEREGWADGRIINGRTCCAAGCGEIVGEKNQRRPWGEPCAIHRGLFERSSHFIEHDPEFAYGESHQTCLRSPEGEFFHLRCAPEAARMLFTIADDEDDEDDESAESEVAS